jgi:probable rRNA maturation factor
MILIEPEAHVPRSALPKRELSRFLDDACERVGLTGAVTVLITSDARLQELNRTFRGKNKPTDVLSFPAAPVAFAGEEAGDLAISAETARRQAESLAHPLLAEVKILILHGLLHLAGMDHEQDSGQMARRENRLRREFGLPVGLIERTVRVARGAATPTSQTRDVGHPVSKSQAKAVGAPLSQSKPGAVPVRRARKSTAGAAAR